MSPKNNFNKAVYDVFGLGNDPEQTEQTAQKNTQPAQSNAEPIAPKVGSARPATPASTPAPAAAPTTAPIVRSMRDDAAPSTYIAPDSVFEGTLKVKGDVEIAGDFKGILEASGKVTIHSNNVSDITASQLELISCKLTGDVVVSGAVLVDEKSSIEGNLNVQSLQCAGQIRGDVKASGHSSFSSTSRLNGNITTGTVTVDRGAKIVGMLSIADGE